MAEYYKFGDFELDPASFRLQRDGSPIAVEPMVFDVLSLLLERAGSIVTKDELIERVWDGRFVSDSTVSTAIKSARKALGDDGEKQAYIRTVRGRGFEFSASVEKAVPDTQPSQPIVARHPVPTLYVRARTVGGGSEATPIAWALNGRLRTVLTRIPLLTIAAPFRHADELDDPRDFHERMGITLLLDTQVAVLDGRILANVSLTHTVQGIQLWARSFDIASAPGAQDPLLHDIVAWAEPAIMRALNDALQSASGMQAQSILLSAMVVLGQKGWHKDALTEVTELIERAIALDPDFPLAHAYLALIRAIGHRVGILRDDPGIVANAIASAERAMQLDNRNSMILGLSGCALADTGQIERALPILRKSIDTDPYNGQAKTALGAALMMVRDFDEAIELLKDGIRISPADNRLALWGTILSLAQLSNGQVEEALQTARQACQEDDRLYMSRLALAAVEVARGDQVAAARAVAEALRVRPDLHLQEVTRLLGERLGTPIWELVTSARAGT